MFHLYSYLVGTAASGSPPSFLGKPVIRQVQKSIVFECRLKADPAPSITWMQGTNVVQSGGRIKISQTKDAENVYILTLEIAEVGIQDGGEYKVLAKNQRGEATATINLNLEGNWTCCERRRPMIPPFTSSSLFFGVGFADLFQKYSLMTGLYYSFADRFKCYLY